MAIPIRGQFARLKPARGYFLIKTIGESLRLHGWMLTPRSGEVGKFALYLNEELESVTEAEIAPEAYDKVRHLGEPKIFQFLLSKKREEIPRFSRIEILGCIGDQPELRITSMFRNDLESNTPTPPEKLMFRVTGNRDASLVKTAGLRSAINFLDAIRQHRELGTVRRLMDWGCGCGRVTAHLADFLSERVNVQVEGCDIDSEAIEWCQANLPQSRFTTISPFPPLPWPEASFDVVVSCSVFTHLTREMQEAWLREMQRVIRRGGLLLASISSRFADGRVCREGISDETLDAMLDGIAPRDYYRGTVQSRDHTTSRWSEYFEILDYIDDGLEGTQDLVVMRRA